MQKLPVNPVNISFEETENQKMIRQMVRDFGAARNKAKNDGVG